MKKVIVLLMVLVFLFSFVISEVSAQPSERVLKIKAAINKHRNAIKQLKAQLETPVGSPGEDYGEDYGGDYNEEAAYEETGYAEEATAPYGGPAPMEEGAQLQPPGEKHHPGKAPLLGKDRHPGLKKKLKEGLGKGPGKPGHGPPVKARV